jgi:pimeloyl-ACP methyl ester carboxylesterase
VKNILPLILLITFSMSSFVKIKVLESNKPTLIFLHGGPGFKDYLRPYFHQLDKSFKTIFYDQIQSSNVNLDELISQLDQIVDEQEGRIILVGHSWGGVLATEYSIRNQEKLSGLVIMSTGLNFYQWKTEFYNEKKRLGLLDANPEEVLLASDERKIGVPFLTSTEMTFSGETFDSLFELYLKTFDLTTSLQTLKLPILNIYGEKDIRFPRRVGKSFKSFNDKITDLEVAGAGHFPFLNGERRNIIHEALIYYFGE